MVPLGYGCFARAEDIVAVVPIDEGRGRGRRTYVHVAGLPSPLVASRSQSAIMADMKAAGWFHPGTRLPDEDHAPTGTGTTLPRRRRGRLAFGGRRG